MTGPEIIALAAIATINAIPGALFARSEQRRAREEADREAQRRETGKRIGRLEKLQDIETGRRLERERWERNVRKRGSNAQ